MSGKKNKVLKYAVIMLIGVLMNQGSNMLASALNLPAWLDTGGTAFASIALEPAAGIIVGFVNNFYLSIVYNDIGTIIYFASSAAVAVICGICMRDKQGRVKIKNAAKTMLLVFVVTTIISSGITIIRSGGAGLSNNWEIYFYNMATDAGVPGVLSCVIATGAIKVVDVIGSALLVALALFVTPKSLKNEVYLED